MLQAMKVINEFKEFAVKGNMIDIAIGVIIGASFNKVVDVLVKQIFLPPLSFLTEEINLEDKCIILREAVVNGAVEHKEVAIGYGKLIEVSIDFLIIGMTTFLIVKAMNKLKRKADDATDKTVKTPKDIELLDSIKQLMEQQNQLLEKQSKE